MKKGKHYIVFVTGRGEGHIYMSPHISCWLVSWHLSSTGSCLQGKVCVLTQIIISRDPINQIVADKTLFLFIFFSFLIRIRSDSKVGNHLNIQRSSGPDRYGNLYLPATEQPSGQNQYRSRETLRKTLRAAHNTTQSILLRRNATRKICHLYFPTCPLIYYYRLNTIIRN